MKKMHFLVPAGLGLVMVLGAGISLRAERTANENCEVELRERIVSPDSAFVAEHRVGVCDEGTSLLHTLEINPSNRKPDEKVIGAVLYRAQGAGVKPLGLGMRFGLRWLDKSQLEVSYPKGVPFSEPFDLNGVRVVGKESR
jgi:hypothetical protein